MSRYIDVTDLSKQISDFKRAVNSPNSDYMTGYICALSVTEGIIAKAPTADVVEVVRCKDCKHHPDNGGECDRSITHTGRDYVCEVNTYRYIGIDYCSCGERRDQNEG